MYGNAIRKKDSIEKRIEDKVTEYITELKLPKIVELSPIDFHDYCEYVNKKSRQRIPKPTSFEIPINGHHLLITEGDVEEITIHV